MPEATTTGGDEVAFRRHDVVIDVRRLMVIIVLSRPTLSPSTSYRSTSIRTGRYVWEGAAREIRQESGDLQLVETGAGDRLVRLTPRTEWHQVRKFRVGADDLGRPE